MMHVNERAAQISISLLKEETTCSASKPVMLKTSSPCSRVALVRVYADLFTGPSEVFLPRF
jgi:hypothetical protein